MPVSFSLITLNCFGALAPGTARRLLALARQLEQSAIQVACLQEVQLYTHQKLLAQASAGYPFHAHQPGIYSPKGGLLTLARLPIAQHHFEPYREQGRWYLPTIMDKLLRKGMLITTFVWGQLPVVIINTHLMANYSADWPRRGVFAQMQQKQLHQLANAVLRQPTEALVVVVGDFNIPRDSALYADFLSRAGLTDPLAGDTRPTHRPPLGVLTRYSFAIDFILVRIPAALPSLKMECDLCFLEKVWLDNRHQDYLSDHNGLKISFSR